MGIGVSSIRAERLLYRCRGYIQLVQGASPLGTGDTSNGFKGKFNKCREYAIYAQKLPTMGAAVAIHMSNECRGMS